MIEIRGDKKVLITPISAEDLADIKIGDIVWLDGDLMTCRDVAHRRLVEYGRELPSTVFSRLDVQLWLLQRLRRLLSITGMSLVCLRLYGATRLKNLGR